MTSTTTLGLSKPTTADTFGTWLAAHNGNMDKIDAEASATHATTLYAGGTAGTTGTVTLTGSASSYARMQIFFSLAGSEEKSVEFADPNGKTVVLDGVHLSEGVFQTVTANYSVSGNTLTPTSYGYYNYAAAAWDTSNNYIHIRKVIGFKA